MGNGWSTDGLEVSRSRSVGRPLGKRCNEGEKGEARVLRKATRTLYDNHDLIY